MRPPDRPQGDYRHAPCDGTGVKRPRMSRWAAAVLCLLGGCAVGPDFQAPAAPSVERYTTAPLTTSADDQRLVEGRDIPAAWWSVFHSPEIDTLVREALAANPDVRAAEAALHAARENLLAQQASLWPTVDAQYNPTKQSIATPLASPLASGSNAYSLHTVQLTIGYVPDVFGGNRRAVESSQAEADVQRFQLEAAQLSLTANLVQAVIQQAATRAQIATTRAMIESSRHQLDLYRRQRQLGQIGESDVATQEAALAQLQASLPPLDKALAQQNHQIAVFRGRLPGDSLAPQVELAALRLPGELPLSLPSKLVEQRPDIRAAEAQLHSASAQIGVAVANRLPSLSLSASGGSAALQFSRLFTAGNGFWSLSATLAQPIFEGGALEHRQRAAEATYDQVAAQYRSTVGVAFQNVGDTLAAIEADARSLDAQTRAEQAAARALAIARRQWAAGATGSLAVLAADQALQQAALGRIQAQADRLVDSVALFQALGGGWWNRRDQPI